MANWTNRGSYRGYPIDFAADRKRRPWRVEVPGRDPRMPGGHAEWTTREQCEQFVDRALEHHQDQ